MEYAVIAIYHQRPKPRRRQHGVISFAVGFPKNLIWMHCQSPAENTPSLKKPTVKRMK
jgi:hypothetical protein